MTESEKYANYVIFRSLFSAVSCRWNSRFGGVSWIFWKNWLSSKKSWYFRLIFKNYFINYDENWTLSCILKQSVDSLLQVSCSCTVQGSGKNCYYRSLFEVYLRFCIQSEFQRQHWKHKISGSDNTVFVWIDRTTALVMLFISSTDYISLPKDNNKRSFIEIFRSCRVCKIALHFLSILREQGSYRRFELLKI